MTGYPPRPSDAGSLLIGRPEKVATEDKIVFGSWWDGPLIVVTDLLLHWPAYDTAHIGLLLVDGRRQNEGLGRRTLTALDVHAKMWHWLRRWRIAVVRSNAQALGFWERMGYTPTRAVQAPAIGNSSPSRSSSPVLCRSPGSSTSGSAPDRSTVYRGPDVPQSAEQHADVDGVAECFLTRRARRLLPGLWLLCEDARRW